MATPQRIPELDEEVQAEGRTILTRVYHAPMGSSLSDMDLEEGDTLPDDATADILTAKLTVVKSTGKNLPARVARVTAEKWTSIATVGNLTEIQGSRTVDELPRKTRVTRRFVTAFDNLSAGAGGWTCTGLPNRGDALGLMTWGTNAEPVCVHVHVEPKFRKTKALVIAVYEGTRMG